VPNQCVQRALLLVLLPGIVSAQVPIGPEFAVNAYTLGPQTRPHVAVSGTGNFVVVWDSFDQDGYGWGVFARRFDASGNALGADFQVNSYTTKNQMASDVAIDGLGRMIVVWHDGHPLDWPAATSVMGQRFDADGVPIGAEFRVNTFTPFNQHFPSVAADAVGNFVVVWEGRSEVSSGYGIVGQRYDTSGAPVGGEFLVNTYTTLVQHFPKVTMSASGAFVAAWQSLGRDMDALGVVARRYDATGLPGGADFQVNTFTTGQQQRPSLSADSAGNFVIAWSSFGQDGSGEGVFGQRFDASGAARGAEFAVNSYTPGLQSYPTVSVAGDGSFVVSWEGMGSDDVDVFARTFDAAGNPQGADFQVNTQTAGGQYSPSVATLPDGRFIIAWSGAGRDGSFEGILAQIFARDLIFEDGFELASPREERGGHPVLTAPAPATGG
jgi:hypothetical protein